MIRYAAVSVRILCLGGLSVFVQAVEIKEQVGVLPESSETRGFFETLGRAASLVSHGQLLRRHDHWQPCAHLSLGECCQREAVRVNDGQGRCRCAQAPAKQAQLCALEWQSCELQKETCCQTLPAMMLVAYGNSSASGYHAQCACAPVGFGKLTQLQLEQRCSESFHPHQAFCRSPSLLDLDDLRRTDLKDGEGGCHNNASAQFSINIKKGTLCLLRFEVKNAGKHAIDLMIGDHRASLPSTKRWVERPFRAPSSGQVHLRIRAPCASLGEVQLATCQEHLMTNMVALATNGMKRRKIRETDLPNDEKDIEIGELKEKVKEDEDKIMELEYKADHAELEKKDAEATAAEPSGGTVPTWLAVGTIVLVLVTGPLLKMKASKKPAAAATPKAAPKAKAKAVPGKAASVAPKAVPSKAAAKAVVPAAKAGKAAAKAKSSTKGSGKGKLQAPEVSFKQLKAILKLQAVARGWKARQDVHPSGPKEKVRTLNEGEQIAVSIQNISVKNIPEVNYMGGVDPFLEVQCGFSKDPDAKGRTSASSEKTDRTEVLSGSNPKFEKTVDLPRVYNKPDQFLNFLIFDSGTAEDTFIGSKSLSVNKLLEGITVFDLQGPPKAIEQELIFTSEYPAKKDIKAKFDVIICEAMKFVFDVKQGEKFPEVDNFGGIDSFIEIRATRSDAKSDFLVDDPKCIWSGRTQVHTDTVAPKYNQEIKATLPADPTLKIQIILWDSNAPMADFPVAHHIMEISEEICHKQNLAPLDHVIKFQKIPGQTPLKGIEKASLRFSLQTSLAEPGVPPPPPPKAAPKATPTVPKAKAGQAKAGQAKAASKATAKPKGAPGTAAKGAVPAA